MVYNKNGAITITRSVLRHPIFWNLPVLFSPIFHPPFRSIHLIPVL